MAHSHRKSSFIPHYLSVTAIKSNCTKNNAIQDDDFSIVQLTSTTVQPSTVPRVCVNVSMSSHRLTVSTGLLRLHSSSRLVPTLHQGTTLIISSRARSKSVGEWVCEPATKVHRLAEIHTSTNDGKIPDFLLSPLLLSPARAKAVEDQFCLFSQHEQKLSRSYKDKWKDRERQMGKRHRERYKCVYRSTRKMLRIFNPHLQPRCWKSPLK